jgi:hypothetical protein
MVACSSRLTLREKSEPSTEYPVGDADDPCSVFKIDEPGK